MNKDYILITPAYNEEKNIEALIECIIAQTIRPIKWLIVNDGSVDRTEELVKKYVQKDGFIEVLTLERENVESYYSRKTTAFLKGYEYIKNTCHYDFIASLDADIIMPSDYYENILKEFYKNPMLGIASGLYVYKNNKKIEKIDYDKNYVPGSLQMFRKECYEDIGGYVALKYGGDDTLATIMARMKKWQTQHFPEYEVVQQRIVGTVGKNILQAKFRQGQTEYGVGSTPIFIIIKTIDRILKEKPYILASISRLFGYTYCYLKREKRRLPIGVLEFLRKEQKSRLYRKMIRNM